MGYLTRGGYNLQPAELLQGTQEFINGRREFNYVNLGHITITVPQPIKNDARGEQPEGGRVEGSFKCYTESPLAVSGLYLRFDGRTCFIEEARIRREYGFTHLILRDLGL